MDDNVGGIHDQEEAEEEALSLSNFPISSPTDQSNCDELSKYHHVRRSSSEPTDFFEFFNDLSSDMSHAEDIIFCGKLLVPFHEQQQQQQQQQPRHDLSNQIQIQTSATSTTDKNVKMNNFQRRRSESMSALNSSQSNTSNKSTPRLTRNSRSLDYQKLSRTLSSNSETTSEIHRNSSVRSSKASKPRWYVLLFGLVRFPPEMELKDMKNRQVRRTPATMFPQPFEGGGNFPGNRSNHRKRSWGLLKVLSCKGHANVAVTTSFGCMPQPQV